MNFHDMGLAVVAFFSEFLGVISGFGSSVFFVPIALFFETMHFVMMITALLHCFANFSKITLFKTDFSWQSFWKLAIPSILLTAVGAIISKWFGVDRLIQILGIFLICLALFFFFGKPYINKLPKSTPIVLSGLSGFFTGFLGTGGALRGLALTAMHLEKGQFVALSSGIDFAGDLIRTAIYIYHGYMDWQQWFYIPILAIAAWLGASFGKRILEKMDQKKFDTIVTLMVLISGIAMIF
ncbi:MAG: sulfite exporter TauE/SafE family protein [Deltaproteobacteria bacterium]|nr:sulfite exporter TauE/SafE family protein [Deltaproteobacteria bacterium]